MWELDVKKAECWRIDAFELWYWRRHLRLPWTARKSNQSILKEINPEYSLEGRMLKLKLQYFGYLMQRTDSLKPPWSWERLMVGGQGDNRGWDHWMASLSQLTWVCINSVGWWWTGRPGVLWFMGSQRVGHYWVTELNWSYREAIPGQEHCICKALRLIRAWHMWRAYRWPVWPEQEWQAMRLHSGKLDP